MTAPTMTAPVVTINTDLLRRRLETARQSGPRAREDAARVLAAAFVEFAVEHAPRDTNRYVNGWIMAARQVGATTRTPLPTRESRYRKMYENVLTRQLTRLERKSKSLARTLDRWYYSKGRRGPWLRKMERELRKLERRAERAREELEAFRSNPDVIVMDLFRRKGGRATQRLATTRSAIYGGAGALLRAGSRVFVRLHNREAHASFVEREHRIVSRAMGQMRRVGVRRAGRAYIERQAIAGGLRVAAGSVAGSRGLPAGRLGRG